MIANVLSLNEMTEQYRVTLDSGDENAFKVYVGHDFVKFTANDDGLYLSKQDNIFRKVDEDNKRNTIEELKFSNCGSKQEGF